MIKVPDTIMAFEEFIGIVLSAEDGRCTPEAANACTKVTVSAAHSGDEFVVASSALWRFLFDPAEYAMNTHRLGGMAQNNGSALLAAGGALAVSVVRHAPLAGVLRRRRGETEKPAPDQNAG